ncbi:DUF58 domain-containing protein [Mycetocola zhujimingii]|uniref:DUF58 domain-containing protein n=1 Tax=Mycetocola zhujimingii TaxID=2079792 RepID=UPI001F2216A4|nr:DUF58 domain-containing protein [Mycetocola zhujimingii]
MAGPGGVREVTAEDKKIQPSHTAPTPARATPEAGNAVAPPGGARDGVLAAGVVLAIRFGRAVRAAIARWANAAAVVTWLGWAVVVSVVLAFLAGYALGWQEFVAGAWAGAVVLAAAAVFLIGRMSHEAVLTLPVNRITAGERAVAQIEVHNPSRRLLPGVRLEVPVGEGVAGFQIPSLGQGGTHEDVFTVPGLRRGVIPVGPVRVVRTDPLGLVRREKQWEERVELFVHPRTIPVPSLSTGFVRDLEGNPTRELTATDVSFHAIREYMPGDERRSIHWRSTAKTGQFMVRQFEETRRSHLMVALSLARADYSGDEDFEMAVSVAGSLGVRAIRDARTVSVVASESTPEFARRKLFAMKNLASMSPSRLLDDLSRVEPTERALNVSDLARVAADSIVGISLAFLVCGSAVTPATLRQASRHFPAGVEVIAVVCDPEIVPSFKTAGELSVLTIGFLEDLQQAMSKRTAA